MIIEMNSENVTRIAEDTFVISESVKDDGILIFVPAGATLVIEGDLSSKNDICIQGGGSVQVEGNISTKTKIHCDGDLSSREGTIFAPDGITCGGFVNAAKSIYCDNGEINADEGVRAGGMITCTNINGIVQL